MKVSERNKQNIAKLHPLVQNLAWQFIEACNAKNICVLIYSTLRSYDEQQKLWQQGRDENGNKIGKTVTNAKPGYSWHNFGLAWDCVVVKNGKADWSQESYKKIGPIGQQLGMAWGANQKHGGNYKTINDMPHFEYHPNLTLKEARQRFEQNEDVLKHLVVKKEQEPIIKKVEIPKEVKSNVVYVEFQKKVPLLNVIINFLKNLFNIK